MGQTVAHFAPPHENRRWMSVTVGEPRERQHLLGCVPSKESLKQGIQWPKTSAAQRTVLLLWHTGDAVSKVPLTVKTPALDSLFAFCALARIYFFFFLFKLVQALAEVPLKDGTHLWMSDTAQCNCPLNPCDWLKRKKACCLDLVQWTRYS